MLAPARNRKGGSPAYPPSPQLRPEPTSSPFSADVKTRQYDHPAPLIAGQFPAAGGGCQLYPPWHWMGGYDRFETQHGGEVCRIPPTSKVRNVHYCTVTLNHCSGGVLTALPESNMGEGGLFRPMGGRGLPDTPPPPWRGGMIDPECKRGRGVRETPPLSGYFLAW